MLTVASIKKPDSHADDESHFINLLDRFNQKMSYERIDLYEDLMEQCDLIKHIEEITNYIKNLPAKLTDEEVKAKLKECLKTFHNEYFENKSHRSVRLPLYPE